MLINNFFYITDNKQISDNEILNIVKLNPEHQIFDGHFPGNPVVPGVVSIQIISEILAEHTGKKLSLTGAKNIKFPAMINPTMNSELYFKIYYIKNEDNSYKVTAQIFYEETVFLKFNGYFSYF